MFIQKFIKKAKHGKDNAKTSDALQFKLHMSQINPEPVFDLNDCHIKNLPKGIYSQCRVFRKEKLILKGNKLAEIVDNEDNRLVDLKDCLIVLDVSYNQINHLPIGLGQLTLLKELYLANNNISSIPEAFSSLKSLEKLDISHNKLNQFPSVFCDVPTLIYLDISHNLLISHIPVSICKLTRLETLLFEGDPINQPPKHICDQGVRAIRNFFNDDIRTSLEKVSKLHDIGYSSCNLKDSDSMGNNMNEDFLQAYLAKRDDQKKRLIEFEKTFRDESKILEITGKKMLAKKRQILAKMKQDQFELHKDLEALHLKRIEDKASLTKALALIEEHSKRLIDQIRGSQIKNRFVANVHPVLDGDEENSSDDLMNFYETKMRDLAQTKEANKESLCNNLIIEEESQRQAIRKFISMKNEQNRILSEQIDVIENELYHLTQAEIQKKSHNLGNKLIDISGQRSTLASLLMQLLQEREAREQSCQIFSNFENDPATSSIDKLDQVSLHDECLRSFLETLDDTLTELYLPIFIEKRITFHQLADMTDQDLISIGINDDHIAIIRKTISLMTPVERPLASAPPMSSEQFTFEPTAPPLKLWYQIECVICLDSESIIILLPCGHVCCCSNCSQCIQDCPLCRTNIIQKIISKG